MQLFIIVILSILALSQSFTLAPSLATLRTKSSKLSLQMLQITTGVEFNTIAREWRLKWSPDNDKKSLASVQQTLDIFSSALKKIDGVKNVQRIVCGGCLDYKVIVALSADKIGSWEEKAFAPEADFLNAIKVFL